MEFMWLWTPADDRRMGFNNFVRWTRKLELIGWNQSPVGTLGRETQELVAPSGCCLGSGNGARRSERVGSREQSYNDHRITILLLSGVGRRIYAFSNAAYAPLSGLVQRLNCCRIAKAIPLWWNVGAQDHL
jgi:hypothetical protein